MLLLLKLTVTESTPLSSQGRDCKFRYSDPRYSQATPTIQALERKQGRSLFLKHFFAKCPVCGCLIINGLVPQLQNEIGPKGHAFQNNQLPGTRRQHNRCQDADSE